MNDEFFHELRFALHDALDKGQCAVVQDRYAILTNEHSGIKRLAMLGLNVLRTRSRVRLGDSSGIMGNGFTLNKAVLDKVPFKVNSIVEDLEYHIRLVESDIKVHLGVLRATWWTLLKQSAMEYVVVTYTR